MVRAFQFCARALAGAEGTVALVIVIEEVDAAYRGWSIGLMGALTSCGYGIAALVFALVNVMPYGWRGLYALALIPLALIIPLRRILPESQRFEREKLEGVKPANVLQPVIALYRAYPRRLALLLTVVFGISMGGAAGGLYVPKFLQEAPRLLSEQRHHAGLLWRRDRNYGQYRCGPVRRSMGACFLLLSTLLLIFVYAAPGRAVIPGWIAWVFFDSAAGTILGAYSVELFPTSYRSTASSALSVAGTTGGAIGLLLEVLLYRTFGSHWSAVRYLLLIQLAVPALIYFLFPETAGRELEEISPEQS